MDSSDKPPPAGDEPAGGLHQEIKFDDVTFKYLGSGERPVVLRAATFEIRKGCSTAIIDRSGTGKTTIIPHVRNKPRQQQF